LALDYEADFLIIDERLGRELAAARGLSVIGVLGILRESYRRGLITDPVAIVNQMRSIGFYEEFCQQL
jgi:hypothetical protein